MKNKFNINVMAEIAIFAALGFALDMLQAGIFRGVWVNGGSIGIAMVPVFVIAYRRGLVPGILCGLVLSIIQMLGGIYVISGKTYGGALVVLAPFAQVLLDYVLAYTVVGLAGFFSKKFQKSDTFAGRAAAIIYGTVLGGVLKLLCHVLAGGLFWLDPEADGFMGVANGTWLYSFVYNGSCIIPCIILSTGVMLIIAKAYPQFLNVNLKKMEKGDLEEKEEETNVEVKSNEQE